MFNLEQAIGRWRGQLAAAGLNSTESLDELEGHLRDDIEAQVLSGVVEEQAFELAVRRLGTLGDLTKEFIKSIRPEAAPLRKVLRTFYFFSAVVAILIDLWTLISFELDAIERVAAVFGVTVFALYLFGLPLLFPRRSCVAHARLLRVTKALGVIAQLWIVFALLAALGIIRMQIGIIPEMVMWSLCAAYGLTALDLALNQGPGGQRGSGSDFPPSNPALLPVLPKRPRPPGTDIPIPGSSAFTPSARRALRIARNEALALGHDFVGTEHVLLGVLKTAGGALARALQSSRLDGDAVCAEVRRLISSFPTSPCTNRPLTPRARKALQFAQREANAFEPSLIGSEHIFLGLLLEGGGVAAMALDNLGIRSERFRTEI